MTTWPRVVLVIMPQALVVLESKVRDFSPS